MNVAIKIYDKFKLQANLQVKKSVSREIKLLSQLSGSEKILNDYEVQENL